MLQPERNLKSAVEHREILNVDSWDLSRISLLWFDIIMYLLGFTVNIRLKYHA